MVRRLNESDKDTTEIKEYKRTLKDLDNKKLLDHFQMIILQNNGTRGKYMDMVTAIKEEILSRML